MDFTAAIANLSWFSFFLHAGPIGLLTSGSLVLLSVMVWISVFQKLRSLKHLRKESKKFMERFWETKSLTEFHQKVEQFSYSPAREVFRAGFNELLRVLQAREKKGSAQSPIVFDTIKRALSKQQMLEEEMFNQRMSLLAISASASPFIGLFGTVVGIIRAFQEIGTSGASTLASVAPGISEALIATALGLFVAIPAAIAFNYLSVSIRSHLVLLEAFSTDFLNIVQRHYSGSKPSSKED